MTSSLRQHERLAPRECLRCLLDRFWFSPRHSPFTPALGSRSTRSRPSTRPFSRFLLLEFSNIRTRRLLCGGMVSLHVPPRENFAIASQSRFPRADIISTRNRVVGSNRCARSFLSFPRVKRAKQTPNIMRATVHVSSACVRACMRRDARTRYTGVCARGINLRAFRDNCAGSYCCRLAVEAWRLCPALLRQLFCYSDGVRVLFSAARTAFRHGALFGFRGRFLPKE